MYHAIEEFIQAQNNPTPIRYSYSNIKKRFRGKTGRRRLWFGIQRQASK